MFERGAKPPKSELGQIPRGVWGWGGGVCTYVVQQKNRQFILETAPQKCVNSGVVFIPVLVCKNLGHCSHVDENRSTQFSLRWKFPKIFLNVLGNGDTFHIAFPIHLFLLCVDTVYYTNKKKSHIALVIMCTRGPKCRTRINMFLSILSSPSNGLSIR